MSKSEDRERAWHHINIKIQYDINIKIYKKNKM